MDEKEKDEFKTDIVNQVSKIVSEQREMNNKHWEKFNDDMGQMLEVTLPAILNKIKPKNNYLFISFVAILNGVIVGLSIYAAIKIAGV